MGQAGSGSCEAGRFGACLYEPKLRMQERTHRTAGRIEWAWTEGIGKLSVGFQAGPAGRQIVYYAPRMADGLNNSESRRHGAGLWQPACALLLATALLQGCGGKIRPLDATSTGSGVTFTAENIGPVLAAFAPASVRLHPLSRWDALATEPTLLCHVELLDDNDDPIKWPASVEITIRPVGGVLATATQPISGMLGRSGDALRFRFTVVDSESAARQFDPVSRSYLARLSGLPEWAAKKPAVSVSIRAVCPIPPASSIDLDTDGEIPAATVVPQ